jgi:signal peptidase I
MNEQKNRKAKDAAPEPPRQSSAREWYESLLVAGIFVLFVRTFVVQTYQVPTGSMERTILIGDHLLVNKFAFAPRLAALARVLPYRDIHRGDIIVFKKPRGEDAGTVLVKRDVAVAGDRVEVRSRDLFLDGKAADTSYVQHMDLDAFPPDDPRLQFGPFTVPPDHFFGMGDNRDNSLDSRFWGPIPRQNIFGRPFLIYWSYEAESNSHIWRGPIAKIQQLASVAIHFFSRTRWDRMFTLVR